MTKYRVLIILLLCFGLGGVLLMGGCGGEKKAEIEARRLKRAERLNRDDSAALVGSIAGGLNHLAAEVVLDLRPPVPVLDSSHSADKEPVLATCSQTPGVVDGPFNYLEVPAGNANFRSLRVQPGDIARYYVIVKNEEDAEHGFGEMTYLELPVRRLDATNPQNALIVEGGLTGPVETPERLEIWRFSDKRMKEIQVRLERYRLKPNIKIGWEPTPDESALTLLLDRLNQWYRNRPSGADEDWQLDPLVETLPESIRSYPRVAGLITSEALASGEFESTEPRQLQQAVWLRDIADWARGSALADVDVASALFDWTVRNIQLDPPSGSGFVHQPWQVLLYGHGTAEQRAWVFAELCRQRQLDVVMLAINKEGQPPRWWLPALVSEGKLYLFDAALGLPLPGAEPGSVATLEELSSSPELLERLALDEEHTYPVSADDLAHVEAQLVASPLQLAERANALEQILEGDDYVVLAAHNRRVSESLSRDTLAGVALWPKPYQAVVDEFQMNEDQRTFAIQQFLVFAQNPSLYKARVLHFQGTKEVPIEDRDDPLAQPDRGHFQATALYQSPKVRPPESVLERLDPTKRAFYSFAKAHASYWLGLLSFDLGKFNVAQDWFATRTLEALPGGPWTPGATYNLARTYEALDDLPAAIKLLRSEVDSPQAYGNRLRAKLLEAQTAAAE